MNFRVSHLKEQPGFSKRIWREGIKRGMKVERLRKHWPIWQITVWISRMRTKLGSMLRGWLILMGLRQGWPSKFWIRLTHRSKAKIGDGK